jgi:hypothetical protein
MTGSCERSGASHWYLRLAIRGRRSQREGEMFGDDEWWKEDSGGGGRNVDDGG